MCWRDKEGVLVHFWLLSGYRLPHIRNKIAEYLLALQTPPRVRFQVVGDLIREARAHLERLPHKSSPLSPAPRLSHRPRGFRCPLYRSSAQQVVLIAHPEDQRLSLGQDQLALVIPLLGASRMRDAISAENEADEGRDEAKHHRI